MRGLLLVNLGTPDAPTSKAVRRYLREFLSDPRVLDINPVGRALLLQLVILPFRSSKSAKLYENIWTDKGSPLLLHSQDLRDKVEAKLDSTWKVELAMRYGSPNIPDALDRLQSAGCDQIVVFALYPQSASSSTGSTVERVYDEAKTRWNVPLFQVVPAFYDEPEYISTFCDQGRPLLESKTPDHVVFSFHGLPERHMLKGDLSGSHCLKSEGCCDTIVNANRGCYRAQCYSTAKKIAAELSLEDGKWTVCFQSRLGRTPWIKPYFDEVLPVLAEKGAKKLLVYSPAFVADCLETLEEIGIRAKEQWDELGGEEITLVPSLNSEDRWVDCVVDLAVRQVQ
jgi:ferrochelatase